MMERLTFEGNFCDIAQCESVPGGSYCESGACSQRKVWERLKEYENTGVEPEALKHARRFEDGLNKVGYSVKRMVELMEADRKGRLVVLPCKVGDTVWAILDGKKHSCECKVAFVNIGGFGTTIVLEGRDRLREQYGVAVAAFGKTAFLTREEAEKALETRNGDQ